MGVKQAGVMANVSGRLLPFSLPYRFFLAACLYQLVMWSMLFAQADALAAYAGGPGPLLAAIHLLTLGVFTLTAIGASMQLIGVATNRPMRSIGACYIVSWCLIPGVALLTWGMDSLSILPLAAGAALVAAGLLIYLLLILDNLLFAPGTGVMRIYTWAAVLSLALVLALGLALAGDYFHPFMAGRHANIAIVHLVLAGYGFMGMFALGFSYILVPMFCLSVLHDETIARRAAYLNIAALLAMTAGLLAAADILIWSALFAALAGCGAYLYSMYRILRQRMRRRLGMSFVLIYLSWCALPAGILCAGLLKVGIIPAAVFGMVLLLAWLLLFLVGVFQRIAPFLATMHLTKDSRGRPPTLSDLGSKGALQICNVGYPAAILTMLCGLLVEEVMLVRAGSLLGFMAGLALLYFLVRIVWVRQRHGHGDAATLRGDPSEPPLPRSRRA